jgi:multiple sugar transport system permease protein
MTIRLLQRWTAFAALVAGAGIVLYPIAVMVRISLIPPTEFRISPVGWTQPVVWQHFQKVLSSDFPRYLLNSTVLSTGSTLLVMTIGTLAAFALANVRRRGMDSLMFVVLCTRMGPAVVFGIPLYLLMVRMRLIDTYLGMTMLYTFLNLPFVIWMLYGFFRQTPEGVQEAGMLDGLGPFGVFARIALPIAAPGMIATATLAFITCWNEFFYSLVFTRHTAKTFPAQVPAFFGSLETDWGGMFAASLMGIAIPILFGLLVRRYMAQGLTMGAVK